MYILNYNAVKIAFAWHYRLPACVYNVNFEHKVITLSCFRQATKFCLTIKITLISMYEVSKKLTTVFANNPKFMSISHCLPSTLSTINRCFHALIALLVTKQDACPCARATTGRLDRHERKCDCDSPTSGGRTFSRTSSSTISSPRPSHDSLRDDVAQLRYKTVYGQCVTTHNTNKYEQLS